MNVTFLKYHFCTKYSLLLEILFLASFLLKIRFLFSSFFSKTVICNINEYLFQNIIQTKNPADSEHLLSNKHIPTELHKYSNDA